MVKKPRLDHKSPKAIRVIELYLCGHTMKDCLTILEKETGEKMAPEEYFSIKNNYWAKVKREALKKSLKEKEKKKYSL